MAASLQVKTLIIGKLAPVGFPGMAGVPFYRMADERKVAFCALLKQALVALERAGGRVSGWPNSAGGRSLLIPSLC
jgi:hypothetical protein